MLPFRSYVIPNPTAPPPAPLPSLLPDPLQIGSLRLPNRVVMAAMATGFASASGRPTPRMMAWYQARAHGGAGLIIVERASVSPPVAAGASGTVTSPHRHFRQLVLADDGAIPAYRRLVNSLHDAGARVALQLDDRNEGDLQQWTSGALQGLAAAFGAAASRARAAGFDAVEVSCAHHSLLGSLLSPLSNRRRDRYGRSAAGRMRAAVEVVQAVRAAMGPHLAVLVKLGVDELVPGGLTLDAGKEAAEALVTAGADAIEVAVGTHSSAPQVRLSSGVGEAPYSDTITAIRQHVSVPVLAGGRILTAEGAEQVLRDDVGQAVVLGRALLADPAWQAKTNAGLEQEVAPCISCLACFSPAADGGVGCPVNGQAGREYLPPSRGVTLGKRIAVLGASLAGLEFALMAAARGHQVELATAGLPLGGLLGLRSGVPGNAEFGRASLYFGDRLNELGVGIIDDPSLNAVSDADVLVDCRPGPEYRPEWATGKGLLLASELLGRDLHELYGIGRRVAVAGTGALAAEVALFLAGWGRRPVVIVASPAETPFPDVHPQHAARLLERMEGYKVPLVTGAEPLQWRYDEDRKSQMLVRRVDGGNQEWLGPFHSAVSAAGWPLHREPVHTTAGPNWRPTPGRTEQRLARWPAALHLPAINDLTEETANSGSAPGEVSPSVDRRVQTLLLGDTPYPEPLRDLVAYAHLLARRI